MKTGYTYKDFISGKVKRTYGKFSGWTRETGLFSTRYAAFSNRSGDVLVPAYLLTVETRRLLGVSLPDKIG